MACGGKCTITNYKYGKTTVDYVETLTPGAPAIPKDDAEAQKNLDAAAQTNATQVSDGCASGCNCKVNKFQLNVPPGKPNDAANVPWDTDTVPIIAGLKRGNNAYTVHGTCELQTQVLDGHCVPALLTEMPASLRLKTELKLDFKPSFKFSYDYSDK